MALKRPAGFSSSQPGLPDASIKGVVERSGGHGQATGVEGWKGWTRGGFKLAGGVGWMGGTGEAWRERKRG